MPDDSLGQGASGRSARAVLILNGAVAVVLLIFWLSMAWRSLFWQSDFSAYYTAWAMVLGGDADKLYDLTAQTVWQQRVVQERGLTGDLLAYNYPPFLATYPVPLALLPRSAAFYVWTLFQVGLLVPMALLLRRLARNWGPNTFLPLLVTVLAFPPIFMTFQMGQVTLILLVCMLGFYVSLKENRPWGVAVALVMGAIKPQLMVIPTFTLLGARRWRALFLAAGLLGAWGLLTTWLLGWSCWPGFLDLLWRSAHQFGNGINPERMYNLKGLLTALLGAEQVSLINAVSAAALLGSVLTALWVWRGFPPADKADFALRAAFTLLLGMVCNPHLNPVDALILVVPAVLFRDYLHRRCLPTRGLDTLIVACPTVFLIDCYGVSHWPAGLRPFFLLMLALLFWMGRELVKERKRTTVLLRVQAVPAILLPTVAR